MGNMGDRSRIGRKADWDINLAEGAQAELWVFDILKSLKQGSAELEVKCDYRTTDTKRHYVELEQLKSSGWVPSGLNVTKAKIWFVVFGDYPGGMFFEVEWLRRAVKLAAMNPRNRCACTYKKTNRQTRGIAVEFKDLMLTADPDYDSWKDAEASFGGAYEAIRERVKGGGPGWEPK
jgi:hypothetical protein